MTSRGRTQVDVFMLWSRKKLTSGLSCRGTELLKPLEFPGGRCVLLFSMTLCRPRLSLRQVTEGGVPRCRKPGQEVRRAELSALSPSPRGTRGPSAVGLVPAEVLGG